nr:YiiX/YebB-like N1pC/P60 family cysteine hydrolase [Hyphomicrobium sp.]
MPPVQSQVQSQAFIKDLERLERLAYAPVISHDGLVRNLGKIYQTVATANFSDHDLAAIQKAAPEIMYRLFDLRTGLRARIADFEKQGYMSSAVVEGLRDAFRILRYVTDMVGEIAIKNARIGEGDYVMRAFTGKDRNTLVNDAFYNPKELLFRTGDVVLVRGRAHNSAAIARIGSGDSQFSHTGIIYIDAEGKHWLVESLIEDGAMVNMLAHALDHGIVRAVLYRHKDAEMAALAAERVHDLVRRSHKWGHRRIRYDFSMQLDQGRNFFCSKLVRYAFDRGSN